jgi:hypothetical protein
MITSWTMCDNKLSSQLAGCSLTRECLVVGDYTLLPDSALGKIVKRQAHSCPPPPPPRLRMKRLRTFLAAVRGGDSLTTRKLQREHDRNSVTSKPLSPWYGFACVCERDTHARTHRDRGDTERERERLSFFLGLDRSFFSEVLVNFFFRLQSAWDGERWVGLWSMCGDG